MCVGQSVKVVERMAEASTRGRELAPPHTKVHPERCCGPPPNESLRVVAPEMTEKPMAELVRANGVLRGPAKVSSDPGPAVTVL